MKRTEMIKEDGYKAILDKLDSMRGNWAEYDFNDVKQQFSDLDLALKHSFISTAAPESANEIYMGFHKIWISAAEGVLEYYRENDAYPEPEDEQRLKDLLELSFFYANKLLNKPHFEGNITPVVSVVMPLYKSFRYVWEALRSIYEQTFQDFEVVIVNEYQNDDPLEEIIALFGDKRTRIVKKTEPANLGKSLNIGIENSRGEFICRMDGDDIVLPAKIEKQVQYLRENQDVSFCCTQSRTIGMDTISCTFPVPLRYDRLRAAIMTRLYIMHSSVVMRKSAITGYGLWYSETHVNEDYELWLRAVEVIKFEALPDCLVYYRIHPSSTYQTLIALDQDRLSSLVTENQMRITQSLTSNEKEKLKSIPNTFNDDGMLTINGTQIVLALRLGGLHLLPELYPRYGYGQPERIQGFLNNRKLVIWGAGNQSSILREMLRAENMEYTVVDQGMEQRGETLPDEPMMSIGELKNGSKEYFVAIATYYRYGGIAKKLSKYGYIEKRDYIYVFEE